MRAAAHPVDVGSPAAAPTPLLPAARSPRRVGGPRRRWDWILASDPGLEQLQAGWRTLVSLVVGLAVGYGTARGLGAPPTLGLMVGGVLGMITSSVIAENTPLKLARAMLWVPFPFAAALSLSVWLHPHHVLELWIVAATMASVLFLARYGTLGLVTGIMLFAPFLVGMVLPVPPAECGRLYLVALVTVAAILAARLVLCPPTPREDLLRTQRAFVIEVRRVADAAARVVDQDADRTVAIRRMNRSLRRLNLTTMAVDGRLARPETAADPAAAELLHQHLFDAEVALQGIGHAVRGMSELSGEALSAPLRATLSTGLGLLRDAHLGHAHVLRPAADMIRRQAVPGDAGFLSPDDARARVLAHRVGDLLETLTDSLGYWLDLGRSISATRAAVPFQPVVALEAGRPAGSGPLARRLAAEEYSRGWRRLVPDALRAPLQLAVATAITLPVTNAFSRSHFYWGPIGVLVALMGTNTTSERVRKLGHRVVGTAVGGAAGILLLHLMGTGHVYGTLLVIVGAISVGSWSLQRGYVFFIGFLVAGLVQLYALSTPGGDLDWLLTQRLLDNALGMAAGTVCAALIFPLSNSRMLREAEHGYLTAVENLVGQVALRWREPEEPLRLRGAARGVNAALYQVESVTRPVVRMPISGRHQENATLLALLGAATRHAKALAAAADADIAVPPELRAPVDQVFDAFTASLRELGRQVTTAERGGTWVRVGPAVRELTSRGPGTGDAGRVRLNAALGELASLDEILAELTVRRGVSHRSQHPVPPAGAPDARLRGARGRHRRQRHGRH